MRIAPVAAPQFAESAVLNIVIIGSDLLALNGRVAKTKRILEAMGHTVHRLRLHLSTSTTADAGGDLQAGLRQTKRMPSHPILMRLAGRRHFRNAIGDAFGEMDQLKPDVIHAIDPYALKTGARWIHNRTAQTKLVFDACEWFEGTTHGTPALRRYVRRTLTRHGQSLSGWLCPSPELAKLYQKHYPNWPVSHIFGNVPDWAPKPSADSRKSRLRQAIKAEPDDIVILFSGALNPNRGLEPLIASAHAIPDGMHLVFMGYGRLQSAIESEARRPDAPRLHALPAVQPDTLSDWLSGADAGLIPYETSFTNHQIATPNKLYEYPCVGVPILASNLPLLRETIMTHGIGDILDASELGSLPSGETVDWTTMLERARKLHDDPNLASRLAAFTALSQRELLPGLRKLYQALENHRS